jgi:AmmeMemoRadiSam system protein A
LNEHERRDLLWLARSTIAARLAGADLSAPTPLDPPLRAGAFVSLHAHGDLRGCIGYPAGDRDLTAVVRECAVSAAFEDPRFPPLASDELPFVQIEISVLGQIEDVRDPAEIDVGRHGLIVSQGLWRGLLLPQVASEMGWDRETFLRHTCLKAGLRPDAWTKGARIQRFEAEVFSEASEGIGR